MFIILLFYTFMNCFYVLHLFPSWFDVYFLYIHTSENMLVYWYFEQGLKPQKNRSWRNKMFIILLFYSFMNYPNYLTHQIFASDIFSDMAIPLIRCLLVYWCFEQGPKPQKNRSWRNKIFIILLFYSFMNLFLCASFISLMIWYQIFALYILGGPWGNPDTYRI